MTSFMEDPFANFSQKLFIPRFIMPIIYIKQMRIQKLNVHIELSVREYSIELDTLQSFDKI